MHTRRWLLLGVLLLGVTRGWAGSLTPEQYQTVKNDILVTHQAEFAQAVTDRDYQVIADAYNLLAVPVAWVWKSSLSAKTIYEETDVDNGIWDWATHMAQTVAEKAAWDTMFFSPPINPSLPQTRGAFTKIYSGNTAQQTAQKAHLMAISRRQARRIELLLRVPTLGDGSTANPATMQYEGVIVYNDVVIALTQTP